MSDEVGSMLHSEIPTPKVVWETNSPYNSLPAHSGEVRVVRETADEQYFRESYEQAFLNTFDFFQKIALQISTDHGFSEENFGLKIALIHSEISEALENDRGGRQPSDHIPEFNGVEEEFADAIIRMMSNSEFNKFRLAQAILAKMKFNASRPFKHGGKKY